MTRRMKCSDVAVAPTRALAGTGLLNAGRYMPTTRCRSHFAWLLAFSFLSTSTSYAQSDNSDILLFVSGEQLNRSGVSDPELDKADFTPGADLLYTFAYGPWRMLGEYFLTDEESELERLQLGYEASADTTFWLGRFHQPISVWNYKYHHGAYLQSSVSRPSIEDWEDDGGVLLSHVSGLLLESGMRLPGGDGFHYSAAVGAGPSLGDEGLHPYDIASQDNEDNGLAASVAVSYFPDYVGSTNIGLAVGYTEIAVQPSVANNVMTAFNIEQFVLNAQVDWRWNNWQLISAAYYVDNRPDAGNEPFGGSFFALYAQVLLETDQDIDLFSRVEKSFDVESAGYLQFFPEFIISRILLGGRIDFAGNQAISIEVSAAESQVDDFTELRIQWSGVFQ